jgi:hypothetical protein
MIHETCTIGLIYFSALNILLEDVNLITSIKGDWEVVNFYFKMLELVRYVSYANNYQVCETSFHSGRKSDTGGLRQHRKKEDIYTKATMMTEREYAPKVGMDAVE